MRGKGRKGWRCCDRKKPRVSTKVGNLHKALEETTEGETIEIRDDIMTPKTVSEIDPPVVEIKIVPGRE